MASGLMVVGAWRCRQRWRNCNHGDDSGSSNNHKVERGGSMLLNAGSSDKTCVPHHK